MGLLAAFLAYGALCPAFLVWWAYGRGPVENTSRAIRRNRDERGPDELSNRDRRPVSNLLHVASSEPKGQRNNV